MVSSVPGLGSSGAVVATALGGVLTTPEPVRAAACPAPPALVAEAPMDGDHRLLDDVRVRALHDEVDREALTERARRPVGGSDLWCRPAPSQQARRVAVALRLLDRALDEVLDEREPGEVRVDVRLRLLARDLEVLRETERRDAVDDAEVDHLGDRTVA